MNRTKNKKMLAALLVVLLVVALAGCGGGGGGGNSGDKGGETVTLRLASDVPLEHMATPINEEACKQVEERTEGRVKINYYPGSQLGSYETVFEEVAMGTIDISQNAIPDTLDPRLGAQYLPYYATSFAEAKVLYGKDSFMYQLYTEICAEQNIKFLGFTLEGFIGMGLVNNAADVFTPGADKKIKLRSPSTLTFRYAEEDLGYNPVTIPYAEVPTAIQTHTVDGWIGGTPNMNYAWVGEIINYMYINYIHAEATSFVISQKSLDKLSKEDQETLISVFGEQSEKSFEIAEENEKTYKEKLAKDYDVEVIELTDAQKKTQIDFIRDKTWTRIEELFGKELMDKFREEVRQFS
jgi:TRAP-type C4-dicarboxylate transport system substrate-binding protein